jgi:hypothetical protein
MTPNEGKDRLRQLRLRARLLLANAKQEQATHEAIYQTYRDNQQEVPDSWHTQAIEWDDLVFELEQLFVERPKARSLKEVANQFSNAHL